MDQMSSKFKLNDLYMKASDSMFIDLSCKNLKSFIHGYKSKIAPFFEMDPSILQVPVSDYNVVQTDVVEEKTRTISRVTCFVILLDANFKIEESKV